MVNVALQEHSSIDLDENTETNNGFVFNSEDLKGLSKEMHNLRLEMSNGVPPIIDSLIKGDKDIMKLSVNEFDALCKWLEKATEKHMKIMQKRIPDRSSKDNKKISTYNDVATIIFNITAYNGINHWATKIGKHPRIRTHSLLQKNKKVSGMSKNIIEGNFLYMSDVKYSFFLFHDGNSIVRIEEDYDNIGRFIQVKKDIIEEYKGYAEDEKNDFVELHKKFLEAFILKIDKATSLEEIELLKSVYLFIIKRQLFDKEFITNTYINSNGYQNLLQFKIKLERFNTMYIMDSKEDKNIVWDRFEKFFNQ